MEAYIGLISIFAGNFAPVGWAFCDGSLIQIKDNSAMFAILGTTYGGDGTTTFALPKLEGPVSGEAATHYIICMNGFFPPRN